MKSLTPKHELGRQNFVPSQSQNAAIHFHSEPWLKSCVKNLSCLTVNAIVVMLIMQGDIALATDAMNKLQGAVLPSSERGGIRIEYARSKMADSVCIYSA